jgi:hypothetical protein
MYNMIPLPIVVIDGTEWMLYFILENEARGPEQDAMEDAEVPAAVVSTPSRDMTHLLLMVPNIEIFSAYSHGVYGFVD